MRFNRKKIILFYAAAIIALGLWLGIAQSKPFLLRETTRTLTQMTGAEVKMHAADFKINGTVLIDDIVIRPNRPCTFDDAIFKAKHVQARFSLLSLLKGRPRITRVTVEDFIVNTQYDVNEARWNTQLLQSLRTVGISNKMPELRLRKGIINYSKVSGGTAFDVITMPVDATFKAADKSGDTLLITIRGADTTANAPALKGTWRTAPSGKIALAGNLSNAKVPLFGNIWNLNDIFISANYDANTINIDQCRMRLGDETKLSAKALINDYKKKGVFKIEAQLTNLYHGPEPIPNTFVYSKSLLENLPGTLSERFFEEYRPRGVVDINVTAIGKFNELSKAKCEGKLLCKNVSVTYKDFPYEMGNIHGEIDFTDRMVVLNKLQARHKDVQLEIEGYSKDFLPIWDCNISVVSPSMVLDDDLYKALDKDQKRAWAVISPQGHIGMNYRFVREPNGLRHMIVRAKLQGVDATYRRFQFPLRNLTGTMIIEPNKAIFDNVISEYDGRRILINGWTMLRGQKWSDEEKNETDRFSFSLDANGLELEKDVVLLLPKRAQKVFLPLKAKGKVRILAQLANNVDAGSLPKLLSIECLGDSIDYGRFAYPLTDIYGKLNLSEDEVEFKGVTAKIANSGQGSSTKLSLDGKGRFNEMGFKEGQFKFNATDVIFDKKMGTLLGKGGQEFYKRFAPKGKADINMESLQIIKEVNEVNSINVQGGIVFKNCSFSSVLSITELEGKLNVNASYKSSEDLKTTASIDVNSIKIREKLLKKLLADIIYDGSARMLEIKNISAEFYGGKFIGTFGMADTNEGAAGYKLNAMCDRINLRDFLASDAGAQPPEYLKGIMSGTLDIISKGWQKNGRIQLRITDMQVAKTSFFGKLLMVLKFTEPKDYAFDNMVITAYLHNNELIIEEIDLGGNAFMLRGEGKLDLEKKKLDLQFVAGGPRFEKNTSVLDSLTEGLWPAIVSLKITGDFNNPQIENTPIPVLKETFEVLGLKESPK